MEHGYGNSMVLSSDLSCHTAANLNDVVILSRNMDEHLKHLQKTLFLLRRAGLYQNPDKCHIAVLLSSLSEN